MASQATLFGQPSAKATRKSYTREFKLDVVAKYRVSSLYATSKQYSLNTKTILRWAAAQEQIKDSRKGSKHVLHKCKGALPDLEAALFEEYQELRKKGLKVKGYWFRIRARQLLDSMHPEATFYFSNCWFKAFKDRHGISLRRPTNICQRPAEDKMTAVQSFHKDLRQKAAVRDGEERRDVGRFSLSQIANMDQTPLPFCFTDGRTYTDKGDKTVWVRGGPSGMEKRQCTVQLTIFADGEPRTKPLIIFRGKGLRIPFREKVSKLTNRQKLIFDQCKALLSRCR